jgi:DNA-binding MarR family transcriptional regulator
VREAHALDVIATAEAAGAPVSQSGLRSALQVDKSNVTRLVQQLVADGRAEQRTADADGRVRLLHLTAKGRKVARRLDDESLHHFELVMARIPAAERRGVLHALEVVRRALELDASEESS